MTTFLQRLIRTRTELVALGILVAGILLFSVLMSDDPIPLPVLMLGLVGGASLALHAIGIALVYRANRIINFAQLQMGVVAGATFVTLIRHRTFIRGLREICPPCVKDPKTLGELAALGPGPTTGPLLQDPTFARTFTPDTPLTNPALLDFLPPDFTIRDFAIDVAPRWVVQLNYWLSAAVALALSVLLIWGVYVLIIRRFNRAPKLVLTVITLAAGIFVQEVAEQIIRGFSPEQADTPGADPWASLFTSPTEGALFPFKLELHWDIAVFSSGDILSLIVLIAAAGGFILFFRRSRLGVVLRGTAENPERAETLGVNTQAIVGRVWILVGFLSGLAAIVVAMKTGTVAEGGSIQAMVRPLAAAITGGLIVIPLAVAGAVSIGLVEQAVLWATGSSALVAGLLLVYIAALLFAQRARASRAERESLASWQASRELRPIPVEVRDLPSVSNALRVLVFVGAFVVLGYPWFMSPSQTNIGTVVMIQAIIGLSLLIVTGWAGQISLGHMAFAALGAWVSTVLGLPFFLSILVGAAAGSAMAILVGLPSLRLRGLHLAISTLAFGFATSSILLDPRMLGKFIPSEIQRPLLLGIDFEDERAFYYLSLAVLSVAILATMGLRRSRIARTLIACKDNEQLAQSFGISLLRSRVVAFAISGFMAAFAGALFAYSQHGLEQISFAPNVSLDVFLMTLIGGLGSVAGPVIGAVYLGTLRLLSGTAFANLVEILLNPGLGVILVFLFLPGGVVQGLWRLRDAWLRRLASRYRIKVPSLIGETEGAENLPITPKTRPGGGVTFIPSRYRLEDQWMIRARRRDKQGESARG